MNTAEKIAVGLSGGVDSAVAALLLKQAGHDVVALVMRLPIFSEREEVAQNSVLGDARRVADCLDLPLEELDFREAFEQTVLAPFVSAYANGLTPNPCVFCNRAIKFGALADAARRGGCEALATGHYARVFHEGDFFKLQCAEDLNQDQSYFLHGPSQEQLAFARFPIGHLSKAQVRALAAEAGLPVSQKRGSRDLCFLPDGDYRALLRLRCPGACQPGPVCHALTGEVLGTHPGTAACTIGQRKGLGIATGEPLFVTAIEPATRTVRVAPRGVLPQAAFWVEGVNWISIAPPTEPLRLMVRTRFRQALFPARVEPRGGMCRVVPEVVLQEMAAPGQGAVFYEGSVVVGGGMVKNE